MEGRKVMSRFSLAGDHGVDIDPPQYIPVSNDSEDCSLEPKACPEPSHACLGCRGVSSTAPWKPSPNAVSRGRHRGHLRSGRIEPGRVQLQFPVQGGAVFRHRSDDRTAGAASPVSLRRPCPGGTAAENFVRSFIADYAFDRSWYLLQADFGLHALRNPAVASHYAARRDRILSVIQKRLSAVSGGNRAEPPHASSRVARLILAVPRRRHVPAPTGTVYARTANC